MDQTYCFLHDPERAGEAAEARRLGGLRRRREGTLTVAYDLAGLDTAAGIRRVLEIAIHEALGLDTGIARIRVLIAAAATAMRLLEGADLEPRLAALEQVLRAQPTRPPADRPTSLLRGSGT